MNNKEHLYKIPKSLDKPMRFLGLPVDEFVVGFLAAFIFFDVDKYFMALAVPAALIVVLRYLKKGNDSSWLINIAYWYLPSFVTRIFLKNTPPSENREYIA